MHVILKTAAFSLIFLYVIFAFLSVSVHALNVTLAEPSPNQVFNSTNNITFTCNASDEGQVLNISLYHSLNGSFSLNQTEYYGELPFDSNTTFLCHFNGGLACMAGGNGNPVANNSLSFQAGKFSQGVRINETGILRYQTSGNFDRNRGTIEFWIRPGSEMTSNVWYIFQAADNDAEDENEMLINIEGGTLYFRIYDSAGTKSYYVSKDVSAWQVGNWYHVAVVWNLSINACDEEPLGLYVNGSSEGTSYTYDPDCDPAISYTFTSSSFSIGSDKYNQSQINATIDDFRISSTVRNSSEINQSYYNGLGNHSSVSKTWNFYNISDGSYIWNCLGYDNDSTANWSSSNRSFYVDMSTQPAVNGILFSPNSSDDIDPGVTINVTANITDPSGVDTLIFQWKEAGEGNWNNITMDYNGTSGLYENTSFQTSVMEGEYDYRIWSNDTKGISGFSIIQNVTSEWDYTWTRSPATFGTVQGLINSLGGNVGILTINNTGDRTLNFTISDNWPLYYNGSENQNFYVTNHTAITINITAQFASSDSENDILITINASHYLHATSPISLTTNATINSYSGGPYFSVSIMEYTGMVSQSQSFSLSAKVKNIGNETAEDTWLNWSLPAGWINISGNITYFAGNISSGSFVLSNLTVTVNPSSASPGTFMIYVNSSCEQNVSGYDSKTVGVSCGNSDGVCGYGCSYVNDNDCGIPTGAPGAGETVFVGGGGGEEIKYIMRMEAPSSFDIQRGDKKTVKVKITNEGKRTNLTSISLSIAGYPLTHIGIKPPIISTLGYNQTGFFELEFFAPNYTKYGIHNITLTARGAGSTGTSKNLTNVEKTLTMSMVVHSAHENETKNALADAEKAIQEMADLGLNAVKAKTLLEEAKAQISNWDYDTSLETSKRILELKEKTFHIIAQIEQVEEGIRETESYGIQTPESKKMSDLSKSAMQREDYAKAEERASSAVAAFMIESQGLETMRFVYANWHFMIAGSALFAGTTYLAYRKSLKGRLRKRIALMSSEEKAVRKLLERTQEERYKEKTLSDSEYHKLMTEHESKLAKIKRKKHRLVSKLISVEKPPAALKNFRKQEESLRGEIQDIQKKYYEQGSVTKSSYQKSVDELREELAESIRNIDTVLAKRKGEAGFLILGILLLSVVFAGAVFAQADEKQAAIDGMERAQVWIKDIEQLGFPASRVNDTLNEARLLFSKGFYKGAESLANDVESLKNLAISIDKKIDEVEAFLYQAKSMGIDVSQPQALFEEALAAFRMEDYERAEELLGQASTRLEELESDYSMKRVSEVLGWEGILKKIQDNLPLILIIAAALIATGIAGAKARRKRKILGRIKSLERKAEKLNSMMKELQTKYFEKGVISESEYRSLMARYKIRLAGAKRKKLVLEGPLNKKEKRRES